MMEILAELGMLGGIGSILYRQGKMRAKIDSLCRRIQANEKRHGVVSDD